MEVGFIGLGRMGMHMVLRLLAKKQKVVAWNRSPEKVKLVAKKGARPARDLPALVDTLGKQKVIWMMLPAGKATENKFHELLPLLSKDDILIDGGNANFKDTLRRNTEAAKKGIHYVDVGVSGGLAGASTGYAMMVGSDLATYKKIEPLLKAMCIPKGYGRMGPTGSGHYVKMIHNAVEYGMMHAIAEGFDLLKNGTFKELNLKKVAGVWNNGCIVSSFLMQMTEQALSKDAKLGYLKPYIEDNGEGKWSVVEAMEQGVPFTVNSHALFARYQSRDRNSYGYRLVAAMRNEFGGHAIKK